MSKIVVALGGNALGDTPVEQLEKACAAAKAIVDLVAAGHSVVVAHGNGPQVGMIKAAFGEDMPFPECTAMSQGYIGYHLQQAIDEELVSRGMTEVPVVAMLTQVVVDENDPAFQNPTKPIGRYFTETEAQERAKATGHIYKEDAGRGWRRVVASPKPVSIYERITLKTLMEGGHVVIAGGGGGIPVIYSGARYHGVDAVVDKDFAAAKLAEMVKADVFLILTAVERVCIRFGKPDQLELASVTVKQFDEYIAEGHFAAGSMLPKVCAAKDFVRSGAGRKAVIASLEKAEAAIAGESGTLVQE